MLPRFIGLVAVFAALCGRFALSADAKVRIDPGEFVEIVSVHLEARLDDDPESGYRRLLADLLANMDLPTKTTKYPFTRALRTFEEGENVCLFPSSPKAIVSLINFPAHQLLASEPIDRVSSHLMTLVDQPIVSRFEDLNGKRVVARNGLPLERYIDNHEEFTVARTPNNESALRMLQARRGDALYGFYPDMVLISEKLGFAPPHFDKKLSLFETTTHFTCKKTPQTELFIAAVNEAIKRLKASGGLQAMLGPHAQLVETGELDELAERNKPVDIVAAHLEGRLDEDPESGFNKLANLIFPRDGAASYQRMPLARGLRFFTETERACMYPASALAVQSLTSTSPDKVLESAPIDLVSSHVFTPPGGRVYNTFDELEGKSMAVQHGVEASQYIRTVVDFDLVRTPNDLSALRMVMAGRVDVMYGWYPDTFIIAEKNKLPLPDFNPDLIIFETTTHLVCKKFAGVEALLSTVNGRIEALRQEGRLQEILGRHARIVEK